VVSNSNATIQDATVNAIITNTPVFLDSGTSTNKNKTRSGAVVVSNSVLQLMRNISLHSSNLPVILEHMVTILCLKEKRALSDRQVLTIGKLIAYGLDKNLSRWSPMEVARMHKTIQELTVWISGMRRLEDDPADSSEIVAEQFLRGI
jgi:hypothetical protein